MFLTLCGIRDAFGCFPFGGEGAFVCRVGVGLWREGVGEVALRSKE